MVLKLENLEACFNAAKENGSRYVAVCIRTEGHPGEEIIVNPFSNFEKKLEYYKKAYNDDLTLKSFNGIRIVGFTYADSFEEVEEALV